MEYLGYLVGGFKIFLCSPRTLGKWSNLTSILFKWVGSTTNMKKNGMAQLVANHYNSLKLTFSPLKMMVSKFGISFSRGGGMNFLHGNKSDFPNNDLGRSSSKIKLTEKCGFLFLVVFSLDPLKSFKKLREPNLKRFENLSSVYGRPGNLRTTLSPQMPTPSPRNKAFRSPTPLKINMEPKDRPIEQEHYLPNLHF